MTAANMPHRQRNRAAAVTGDAVITVKQLYLWLYHHGCHCKRNDDLHASMTWNLMRGAYEVLLLELQTPVAQYPIYPIVEVGWGAALRAPAIPVTPLERQQLPGGLPVIGPTGSAGRPAHSGWHIWRAEGRIFKGGVPLHCRHLQWTIARCG
jgi:hypothetical protein